MEKIHHAAPGGSIMPAMMKDKDGRFKTRVSNIIKQVKPIQGGFGFEDTIRRSFSGLRTKFTVCPFSVFFPSVGAWPERKRVWKRLGIRSEEGRGTSLTYHCPPNVYKKYPNGVPRGAFKREGSTSIFDPVLCETLYRWFTNEDHIILDPFAGGSVRGIVAAVMGRRYFGIELRKVQVDANRQQVVEICPQLKENVTWACGDAVDKITEAPPQVDFVFSCPPYGNLERYSDDPKDLSTMTNDEFNQAYRRIIQLAVARLKDNRFACFVVSNYRDRETGYFRDFVSVTNRAFAKAGMGLYNEIILVTPIGSLPIRVTEQFGLNRKVGRRHQNVLIYYKGDVAMIRKTFGKEVGGE